MTEEEDDIEDYYRRRAIKQEKQMDHTLIPALKWVTGIAVVCIIWALIMMEAS